jgi:hypothetical protein
MGNTAVRDAHTYFVGELGAWVHNTCSVDTALSKLGALEGSGAALNAGKPVYWATGGAGGGSAGGYVQLVNGQLTVVVNAAHGGTMAGGRALIAARNGLNELGAALGIGEARLVAAQIATPEGAALAARNGLTEAVTGLEHGWSGLAATVPLGP